MKNCVKFIPPDYCKPMLALIMPENFLPINDFSGFLKVHNYIIYITSIYLLISNAPKIDDSSLFVNNVNLIENEQILTNIKDIFSKMGITNAYLASKNQYVGYDEYVSVVFGDYLNLNL